MRDQPNVVILTGMSGAGRSTAAKVLEDLGYPVIDNLPPSLIEDVVRLRDVTDSEASVALVVDARGGLTVEDLREPLYNLRRDGLTVALMFLDADDHVLLRRYRENRRPHPVPSDTIQESIRAERELMTEVRAGADIMVDTTNYNVHQLRERVESEFAEADLARKMRVSVSSFGFKHGAPRDVDLLLDVRFLPNPHWVPELRPLTGTDPAVRDYVLDHPDGQVFLAKVTDLLEFLLPRYMDEGKSYLSIGVGCTGGRHRSVALAEAIAAWCEDYGVNVNLRHRDRDLA